MQVLRIAGIETVGRHGASDGEQDAPQPFRVDVEVGVDPGDDHIEATADYRMVVTAVREVVEGESHSIIETIAERVAARVAELPHVKSVRAVVHKPAAADRYGVSDLSAEASAGVALPHGE
jgi:dihydroneopterin aldolase